MSGFASPLDAYASGTRETLLYLPAVLTRGLGWKGETPDYLATVDVDPTSATYSQVIHRLPMPVVGDELHHMGWNACSSCRGKTGARPHTYLCLSAVLSGNIYFVDVKTDPRAPAHYKTIQGSEIAAKTGLALPHTSHCAPDEIIVSHMGGIAEKGFLGKENGFLSIDPQTLEITGRWDKNGSSQFGYDFWYQPRLNVMVSTEWGEPSCFAGGFNPAHVADGKYGQNLYVWDWAKRTIVQTIDLGVGSIPLEVRFLHDPDSTEGYVGCALTSAMVRFYRKADGVTWASEEVIKIPALDVTGWALPQMPGLITDFVISLDDRFLYLANWLHGDIRQYDITNRSKPVLVGQVFIGGSVREGKGVTVTTPGYVQPKALVVKGVEIQGGAQMVQLSLDGKRLYVTTSLFSVWDGQFYPELVSKGGQLLVVDVNTEKGGLTLNENFLVDFGAEPFGPALPHEMRFPGGDCTSDIWI